MKKISIIIFGIVVILAVTVFLIYRDRSNNGYISNSNIKNIVLSNDNIREDKRICSDSDNKVCSTDTDQIIPKDCQQDLIKYRYPFDINKFYEPGAPERIAYYCKKIKFFWVFDAPGSTYPSWYGPFDINN